MLNSMLRTNGVFPGVGGGLFLEGQDGVPLESETVPVLVVLLTRYVISANLPIPTKLLFLHLSMGQYLADFVVMRIKRNDS